MTIRPEISSDWDQITRLTREAFAGAAHACGREYLIPDSLRVAGALTVSLVAEMESSLVVGHVAFSPVMFDGMDRGWHGAGPLSVAPDWQRRGVGTALMREGLARLRALGSRGCVLVGDPVYYARLEFRADSRFVYPGVPPEYFLALPFDGGGECTDRYAQPVTVTYHPAFMSAIGG